MSRLWAYLSVLALCAVQPLAIAQEPQPAGKGDVSLGTFHRLFLPEREIEQRTWKHRYLPVDAEEFERDLQAISDYRRGVPGSNQPRLLATEYTAQLISEDLLVGTARFQLPAGMPSPTTLCIDPCTLAIEAANWLDRKKTATIAFDSSGRLQLLVEGRQLEFRWSQRGQRTASGAVQFELGLPSGLVGKLDLAVPDGSEIVAEGGIVTRGAPAEDQESKAFSRWTVEFARCNPLRLRVVPQEHVDRRRPLTLLRQAATYEFTARGVNVASQLRLDVHSEPMARLEIEMGPTLHLVAAKMGDMVIPWSSSTDAESGNTLVILEFPEPLSGTGRVIQLAAVMPLTLAHSFSLPRVQPRNVAWQEGTANLIIPTGLVLEQLETKGCRQSRVTALPAPLTGESIEVQFYEPSGEITTRIVELRQQLKVNCAHLIEIAPETIRTSSAFEINAAFAASRLLDLPLRSGWTVDSVQSEASGELLPWEILVDNEQGTLRVERGSVNRVLVRAHAPQVSNEAVRGAALRAFELAGLDVELELFAVEGSDGLKVHWPNDVPETVDAATLPPDQLKLFSRLPTANISRGEDIPDDATFGIERDRPEYTAEIKIDVIVQQQTLTETFNILCTPASARVDRLLVQLSESREGNVKWSLAGGNNSGAFSARRLSDGERAKLGLAKGETWELLLTMARPGAFEVRGQRTVPFKGEVPVSLARVQGADDQRGTLAIRALGDVGLAVHNQGLLSVPAEVLEDTRYQTVRAAYHYQPGAEEFAENRIVLTPTPAQQAVTGAWAWSVELVSRLTGEGTMTHVAQIDIQTAGRRRIDVRMPQDASILGVRVDSSTVSTGESDAGEPLQIELPAGKSRVHVFIRYATPAELPGLAKKVAMPAPTLDVPVVEQSWQLWLPPGFRIGESDRYLQPLQWTPLTWSERLFGVLGRKQDQNLFNPLIAGDWQDSFAGSGETAQIGADTRRWLASIDALLADYEDAEELTWGQFLSAAAELRSQTGYQLCVDPDALADLEITPLTRLRASDASAGSRTMHLLQDNELVLITAPGVTWLTSSTRGSGIDGELLDRLDKVVMVARGELRKELHDRADTGLKLVPTAAWLASSDQSSMRLDASNEVPETVMPVGWRRYDISCSAASPKKVLVVHVTRMQSLAWAAMLGCAGLILWRRLIPAWIAIMALSFSGALALAVPSAYAPLAGAMFLGVLLGLLGRLLISVTVPTATSEPQASGNSGSHVLQRASVTSLALAAFLTSAERTAAEPLASPDKSPVYTVLVPVEDDLRQASDKIYVPEPLYANLLRAAMVASGRPTGWMIESARYDGTLSRNATSSRVTLNSLRVRFALVVFQADPALRFPVHRESWEPVLERVSLDGRPLRVNWSDQGLELGAISTGSHAIDCELRTPPVSEGQTAGIDLPIPRVAEATLSLSAPQDFEHLEVPSARGRVTLDAQRHVITAQLGAAERLAIRWPIVPTSDEAGNPSNLQVEELVWVRVRPGTTVLDARFKFQVSSGELRTVKLATDPRLRLLNSPAADSTIAAVRTFPGNPQIVELELAQQVREAFKLDLSFLITDASGVGNLRLPRLETSNVKLLKRWLAVSVDPALQYRIQAGEDSASLEVSKFLDAWGIGDAKPLAAYSIPRGEPIWFLATQPAEPRIAVEQKVAIGAGRHSALVHYDAQIDISSGVVTQLAVESPPGFKVDRISVKDQDVERVARWSVGEDGLISVFLTTSISGKQQFALSGRWPFPEGPKFRVPSWNVQTATVTRTQWEFYRQSDVLLSITPPPEARLIQGMNAPSNSPLGRLAQAFAVEAATEPFGVQVAENDPQVHAVAVSSVRRDDNSWLATLDYHLNITDGVLDSLQFELPAQLVDPFRVEPAAQISQSASSVPQRRLLTVVPAKSLSGKQRVRIQGRIAPQLGDRLKIPAVRPLGADHLDWFVLLPKRLESQSVSWETAQLASAKLPRELMPQGWNPDAFLTFKVQDNDFQALLRTVQRDDETPVIQLADIQVAWMPEGGWRAAANFDILPGGATTCALELPPQCELIHATVEFLPASLRPLGEGKYRLELGPQRLPQRVALLYRSRGDEGTALTAPKLAGVEPLQTLWSVFHSTSQRVEAVEPRWSFSEADQQLARLTNIARLVDLPTDAFGEHLPEEIVRWYTGWRRRYAAARAHLQQALSAAGRDPNHSEEAREARGLDQKILAVDDRFGITRAAIQLPEVNDLGMNLARTAGNGLTCERFSLKAADGPLRIRVARAGANFQFARLGALVFATIGGIFAWRMRGRELPRVSPFVVAVGITLGWWLLLGPSVWGLIALSVLLVTALWNQTRISRPAA